MIPTSSDRPPLIPRSPAKHWQRTLKRIIQMIIVLVVAFFIVRYFQQQWDSIKHERLQADPVALLLAQVILITGLGLLPFGSWLVVRFLEGKDDSPGIWHAFFTSQIAKYLPGSVWALPSRAFIYHQRGLLTATRSIEAIVWESGLCVVGATLTAVLGLPLLADFAYRTLMTGFLVLFSLAFLAGAAGLRTAWVRRFLQRLPDSNRLARSLKMLELHLTARQIVLVTLVYAANWVVIGLSFAALVRALASDLTPGAWLQMAGLFAGAWAVGFLVIVTPGGIGVRDGLLAVGIANLVSDPLPLVIAVLARIGWVVAEIACLTISSVILACANRRLRSPGKT